MTDRIWRNLQVYVAFLTSWQRTHNLVSPGTLPKVWERHIRDSWQLLPHCRDALSTATASSIRTGGKVLDFGSGAGFPGLVLSIGGVADVQLIEANQRKAAFLRFVTSQMGTDAVVHAKRIEHLQTEHVGRALVITGRALAPLTVFLMLAEPYCGEESRLLLPKGKRWKEEVAEARRKFGFELRTIESVTDREAMILEISQLRRLSL